MTDPHPVRLSEERARQIFYDQIVPEQLARGVPQEHPIAMFVAGQPGAGKTATTRMIKAELDRRGGAIIADADRYKPYHPEYARLLAEDDQMAAALTSPDSGRWMRMAQEWLAEHKIDTLTETTMRDESYFARPAGMFRQHGYRVEAAVMAVPEAQSRLGILDRYDAQVRDAGHGRLTLRDNHDSAYAGVLRTAEAIDRDRLADAVSVYRRGNELLYENELTEAGEWRAPAGTREAIEQERARPWTAQESANYAATYNRLAGDLDPEFHDEMHGIAESAEPLLHPDVRLNPPDRSPVPSESDDIDESIRRAEESLNRADTAVREAIQQDRQPDQPDPIAPRPDREDPEPSR